MTTVHFQVLLQMIDCRISNFNMFSLVHILRTCFGSSLRKADVFRNTSALANVAACFPFPVGNNRYQIPVYAPFADSPQTWMKPVYKLFADSIVMYKPLQCNARIQRAVFSIRLDPVLVVGVLLSSGLFCV